MQDDSAFPRNTDPSVVSQTLPWGVTQTGSLNSVSANIKSVLSHFDKCVLGRVGWGWGGGGERHFLLPTLKSVENSHRL